MDKSEFISRYLKTKSGCCSKEKWLLDNCPNIYQEIKNFGLCDLKLNAQVWHYVNNVKELQFCKCGNRLRYRSPTIGYNKYCSSKCACSDPEYVKKLSNANFKNSEKRLLKIKKTNLKKYGVENVFQNVDVKNKIKKTNLEKRGVEYATQSIEVQNKTKKTNLKKYGVENVYQCKEIKDKIKETNLEKYGVDSYSKTDQYKRQFEQTSLEKYGTKHPFQNDEIKERAKKTFNDKYGVNWGLMAKEVRDKIDPKLIGRKFSTEHRAKIGLKSRLHLIGRIENIKTFYNKRGCDHFDRIMQETNSFIQHAENGGEFYVKELGYWLDGYDAINNIAYEWDERQHFDKLGNLKNKDVKRQNEITNLLKCIFVRIKQQ